MAKDHEDDLDPKAPALPPGVRDPRTMSSAAFHLARFLSPEERAEVAARPRFRFAPWLRLVTNVETSRDDRSDALLS